MKRSGARYSSQKMGDAVPEPNGERCEPQQAAPGLHLVATPIGNLGDISKRALDILRGVDIIACEDSRVTGKLLKAYGIDTKTKPYHDHNANAVRPWLIKQIQQGRSVALVSDAGTPLVSDPGYKLVRAVVESDLPVSAVPGPMAGVMALVLSGLPADRFLFAGFLPNKAAARRRALLELKTVPATLIFYESARRLAASLADMAAVLGPRPAVVARELTKIYEQVVRGSLLDLQERYAGSPPKGEIVVVVAPPDAAASEVGEQELDEMLARALAGHSLRDGVAAVAEATGVARRVVYERALALRDD
ncbi:MAG: 16S rRNA (cytidine(1402)-2'-O)-methyltransferase [Alphaproteobacteria bacterium]